ncbi:MAG: heparinase II/III family protein, partial [Gemmatimonadota bacterium]|nr:heparinase II/III family protein [Gemmatimonadota bacterium]
MRKLRIFVPLIVLSVFLLCFLFLHSVPLRVQASQNPAQEQYKEDFNGDGNATISDVIALLTLGRQSPGLPRADYNGDGKFAVTDVIALLLNIIKGNLTLVESSLCLEIRGHPRLVISGAEVEDLRVKVRTTRKAVFDQLVESVDGYLSVSPYSMTNKIILEILTRKAAFVYLMTGESRYLDMGKDYLKAAASYYRELASRVADINWEVVGYRRSVACAYDWLYQGLTPEERSSIGQDILLGGAAKGGSMYSPYDGGGYGWFEPQFYPAMALVCEGVNDVRTGQWFDWARTYMKIWKNVQVQVAADDGGVYSGMGYASYNYIRAPVFVFETWRCVTGENLLEDHTYLKHFPIWWIYGLRPNGELSKIDDLGNVISDIWPWHFKYVASRYNCAASKWLAETLEPKPYTRVWDVIWDTSDLTFEAAGPDSTWPAARHFEGIGWVVMRSGWDQDATHAILNCGDFYYGHQHADENSFVIYKKGSLAIDSGRHEWTGHRSNYGVRTIAHNTILVYNPSEVFASGSETYVNDGGQRWPKEMPRQYQDLEGTQYDTGDIAAFETSGLFSYACGDATNAYSSEKMELFTRQFIHLQPDAFVVFDRVKATRADYKKYWLLHTVNEPNIEGNVVEIHEREGKLFTRTVLPENAQVRKVGGPGHEFDVFGVNYPPGDTSPEESEER